MSTGWRKIGVAAMVALMLACVSNAHARVATVTLQDGTQIRGDIESDTPNGVRIVISGISQYFTRDKIRDTKYELTPAEEYQQERAKLADDDVDGRYKLAFRMFEKKGYEQAHQELLDLVKKFPDDERVKRLLYDIVEPKIKLMKEPPVKPIDPVKPPLAPSMPIPPAVDAPVEDPAKKPKKDEPILLTPEDINIIRVYEYDGRVRPQPVVVIPPKTVDRFIERFAPEDAELRGRDNQRAFKRLPGAQQINKFFEHKAREFYREIEIKTEPPAMLVYKTSIHRNFVLNYCGTVGCHGGDKAGEFKLIPTNATRDEVAYTNFFILNSWVRGKGYMIDRDKPEESYLLQYALPRVEAATPHPDVKGWTPNPGTRSTKAPLYLEIAGWIRMLYPSPQYGVSLAGLPAPQPANDAVEPKPEAAPPAPAPAVP